MVGGVLLVGGGVVVVVGGGGGGVVITLAWEFPKCSVFRRVKRVVSSCVCLGGKLPPQLNRFFETAKERCKGF